MDLSPKSSLLYSLSLSLLDRKETDHSVLGEHFGLRNPFSKWSNLKLCRKEIKGKQMKINLFLLSNHLLHPQCWRPYCEKRIGENRYINRFGFCFQCWPTSNRDKINEDFFIESLIYEIFSSTVNHFGFKNQITFHMPSMMIGRLLIF